MFKFSNKQKTYLKLKRFLDIFLAILFLIFLSPLFFVASLLVRISSPGPVFFMQVRPGVNKKPFRMYKFRTMRIETLSGMNALKDSQRLTFFGTFLRKSSIDELPQIVNVIRGEMSFIGPRPLLFNDLKSLSTDDEIRFLLRPGISSYAGVNGRNSLPVIYKYKLENFYVKKISLTLDVKIFFKTIFVVFKASNIEDKVNKERIAAEIIENEKEL